MKLKNFSAKWLGLPLGLKRVKTVTKGFTHRFFGAAFARTNALEEIMQHHFGRLIDHVHIVVSDLEKSRKFYRAVLESLGRSLSNDDVHDFGFDELFVSQVNPQSPQSHIHLAFQVSNREGVDKFYSAAIAAGGKDNGRPGERTYHPGYYAAFVLDPDGNNLEAVFHGPAERSVESVILIPK